MQIPLTYNKQYGWISSEYKGEYTDFGKGFPDVHRKKGILLPACFFRLCPAPFDTNGVTLDLRKKEFYGSKCAKYVPDGTSVWIVDTTTYIYGNFSHFLDIYLAPELEDHKTAEFYYKLFQTNPLTKSN